MVAEWNLSEMDDEVEKTKSFFFNIKEAYDEVRTASGAKETALAGAKLVGKGLFNTALHVGKAAVDKVKEANELKESYRDLGDAELSKLREKGRLEEKMAVNAVLNERKTLD